MNLFGASFLQHAHNFTAGRSRPIGMIDQYDGLIFDNRLNGILFNSHAKVPLLLLRLNKRAANIPVFN